MRKATSIMIFAIGLFLASCSSLELVVDASDAEERVHMGLDKFMQSEDYTNWKANYADISGTVDADISVFSKGKVQTVFMADSDIEDVKFRNSFKDLLKQVTFDFKVKKGKHFKIRHKFNI